MSNAAREKTSPDDITNAVVASFSQCPDPRLQQIMRSLVGHLHAFVNEVQLTHEEWMQAIRVLSQTGHITDATRQEWILWSDTLGISMLVDALEHRHPGGVTESTVLGPFYVPNSPTRQYGAHLDEISAGDHMWVHGRVLSEEGTALAGAELDVWQNGDNKLYAVQDAEAPETHLRGRFHTRPDGTYGFVAVRPTPYPIPDDGPVGTMLTATGRHPWRPAHLHVIVRASGHQTLTTHLFDADSPYLDSDAVFAVKPSLLRSITRHNPDDQSRRLGLHDPYWCLESDFVLAHGTSNEPADPGRTA